MVREISPNKPLDAPSPPSWALVIDDHPLFCDALELTLKSVATFSTIILADSMAQAFERLDDNPPPSLILLDLNLPDVTGLDGLIKLKRTLKKDVPVIIVSSMTDNAIIRGAITAGASGFVPKHSGRSVFKDAIDCIAAGRVYKPDGYIEGESTQDDAVSRLASLTNQQGRILELICEGKLNKQIAYDLSIAETTVKAHVTAIMRKLGVQSRTQAVLTAQNTKFESIASGVE